MMNEVVIRGNHIGLMEDDMNTANFAQAGIYVTSAESLAIEGNEIRLPRSVAAGLDKAHIYVKNIGRCQARNNRRPEDGSRIQPWDAEKVIFLPDAEKVIEQQLEDLRTKGALLDAGVGGLKLQDEVFKGQIATLQSQVKVLQAKKGWFF